jgi:hypothetical protein
MRVTTTNRVEGYPSSSELILLTMIDRTVFAATRLDVGAVLERLALWLAVRETIRRTRDRGWSRSLRDAGPQCAPTLRTAPFRTAPFPDDNTTLYWINRSCDTNYDLSTSDEPVSQFAIIEQAPPQ